MKTKIKNIKNFLILIIVFLMLIIGVAITLPVYTQAQVSSNFWKVGSSILQPVVSTYQLKIPFLGGSGSALVCVDNNGLFAVTGCPSGGSGSGDVVGPASSVDSNVVLFDGTTGKLIKDSGLSLSSFVPYTGATTNLNLGGNNISATNALIYSNGSNIYYSDTGSTLLGSTNFTSADTFGLAGSAGGRLANFIFGGITGTQNYTLPDASGTICLTTTCSTASTTLLSDLNAWSARQNFNGNASTTGLTVTGSTYLATTGGNVGIGTTTPAWKLQVAGTRPDFAISDSAGGTNAKHMLLSNRSGNLYIGTSTDVYATTTPIMTLLNNGNVGVGTANPLAQFVVGGNNSTAGFEVVPAGGAVTFQTYNRNTAAYANTNFDAAAHVFRISGTERARINTTGYLGIGSTSPTKILTVEGNQTGGIMSIVRTLGASPTVGIYGTQDIGITGSSLSNGTGAAQTFSINGVPIGNIASVRDGADNTGSMVFNTYLTGTPFENLRLLASGANAFGTSTAVYPLTVFSDIDPQLSLSAGAGIAQWTQRNAGGNLYVATTTVAGTATSSVASLSLLNTGDVIVQYILRATRTIISGISSAFTPSVEGEIGIDTTSNQFKYYSGGAVRTLSPTLYSSFTYSTSTSWTGTTTVPLGTAYVAETWIGVQCFTDTGTLNVSINDGTNRMNMFNSSTTVGTVTLSTNNTWTASEKRYVDIGTPATSPTKISCTVAKTITAD